MKGAEECILFGVTIDDVDPEGGTIEEDLFRGNWFECVDHIDNHSDDYVGYDYLMIQDHMGQQWIQNEGGWTIQEVEDY